MEADRVHSYLKIACSALGFEVGEVWITSNEIVSLDVDYSGISNSSGTNASSVSHNTTNNSNFKRKRKIHFLQLYTSKNINSLLGHHHFNDRNVYKEGIDHALSPLLVNAVAETAQIIWAHCQNNKDGLSGRPDMLFQTAVGVPVANDAEGNMFIVVMFSPNNISSSKEAIEYLKYIGTFATSTTIPCLLPVVKDTSNTFQLTYSDPQTSLPSNSSRWITSSSSPNATLNSDLMKLDIGSGITAQLISFHDFTVGQDESSTNKPLLEAGPQDDPLQTLVDNLDSDVFDDASYGLWNTIMNSSFDGSLSKLPASKSSSALVTSSHFNSSSLTLLNPTTIQKYGLQIQSLSSIRKERLEEFASAFLGLSVFDAADVWVPVNRNGSVVEGLTHAFSVLVTQNNEGLNQFQSASVGCIVLPWSGAIGQAFWSGNPVWSTNKDIIVEAQRSQAYDVANISTTLSVPIFSDGAIMPSCVMCFYSLIRVDAVPFVLHFIQKALRLLWVGLDKIEPHESISRELWENIAPADLGEMAADTEMQTAFVSRKRRRMGQSHDHILRLDREGNETLSAGRGSLAMPNPPGDTDVYQNIDTSSLDTKSEDANTAADAFLKLLNDMMLSCALHGNGTSPSLEQIDLSKSSMHSVDHLTQPSGSAASIPVNKSVPLVDDKQIQPYKPTKKILITAQTPSTIGEVRKIVLQDTATSTHNNVPNVPMPHIVSSSTQLSSYSRTPSISDNSDVGVHPILSSTIMSNVHDTGLQSLSLIRNVNNSLSTRSTQPTMGSAMTNPPDTLRIKEDVELFVPGMYPTEVVPYCLTTSSSVNPSVPSLIGLQGSKTEVLPYCLTTSSTMDPSVAHLIGSQGSNWPKSTISSKVCEWPGCSKFPQGPTRFCISHGGGHRCQYPGCMKGARDKKWCTAHGGGKRCEIEGCSKAAVGASSFCTNHGGGRRCAIDGCFKAAQSPTPYCVKHGGGKKCAFEGCDKVARGRTTFCASHGGGIRCKMEGCARVAIGKYQLCRTHGGKSQRDR